MNPIDNSYPGSKEFLEAQAHESFLAEEFEVSAQGYAKLIRDFPDSSPFDYYQHLRSSVAKLPLPQRSKIYESSWSDIVRLSNDCFERLREDRSDAARTTFTDVLRRSRIPIEAHKDWACAFDDLCALIQDTATHTHTH